MSSYVRKRRWRYTNGCDYDVIIKCDGCGRTEIAAEGQTDRLLVNGYVHENDWKTTKRNDKWINLCPDCKRANSTGENIKDKRLEEALVQFANHLREILQDDKPKGISGEYAEYIKSAEWQAKRNERLRIDNYTCQRCGGKRNLQVHHITYANIGHEDVHNDLVTLCKCCHEDIEREKRKNDSATPCDFVLREVKRLNDVDKKIEEKIEEEKRQAKQRRNDRTINTHNFIEDNKSRDIGFGGRENLCNILALTLAIENYGLTREDVRFLDIQNYFTYHRWLLVRKLHDEGALVGEITRKMNWKRDKVEKALAKLNGDFGFKRLEKSVEQLEADYLFGCE
jgi:hypothetical protein